MELKNLFIGLIVFSAFGVLIFNSIVPDFYGEQGYQTQIDPAYAEGIEAYNETTGLIVNVRDTSPGGVDTVVEPDNSLFGSLTILLSPLSFISSSVSIVKSLLTNLAGIIGIHPIIVGMAVSVLIIVLAIMAVNAFVNNKM